MKTIKGMTIILALFAMCVVIPGFMYSQETAGQIYERALYLEESQGDLKGAMALYEKVVTDNKAGRAIAAKAQLHIGLCSEKLGMRNAQKEYQAVIDSYPEFEKEVSIAKDRLSRLAKVTGELEDVANKPVFTKIQIPTAPGHASLSPDGNRFAIVSKDGLWIAPVHGKVSPNITGEPVRLPGTEGAVWPYSMYLLSWSGDGKWIAYLCSENNTMGICAIPSSGGKAKMIVNNIFGATVGIQNSRFSLSPDGSILVFGAQENGDIYLSTIHVEGGEINQLTEPWNSQPAFSPNGEKIAYVKAESLNRENLKSDVWVVPATGGSPVLVSDLPGVAVGPIWSPDGKMIAFLQRQSGDSKAKICIVPISDTGAPQSSPAQIELPLATEHFLSGWTPENRIGILLTNPNHNAIYTVPAAGGKATQVSPNGGPNHPRWSPDGKRIYFRWSDERQFGIASLPSEGGKISYIYQIPGPPPPDSISVATPGGGVGISPDGETIVFSGAKSFFRDSMTVYEIDIYTVPVQGGEPTKITVGPGEDRFPSWSPDGKSIAFIRATVDPKDKNKFLINICIVPAEGGEVRQLTSDSHQVQYSTIAWSPDGKWIAYFSEQSIEVIPVQGGESREVVKVEDVQPHSEMAWSQNARKIAYSSNGGIWLVSLDGGMPERIETGLDANVYHVSWSPDGGKIVFCASKSGGTDLWFMEDFLPLDKLTTK